MMKALENHEKSTHLRDTASPTARNTRQSPGSLALAGLLLSLTRTLYGCSSETVAIEPADLDTSDLRTGEIVVNPKKPVVTAIERFSPEDSVDAIATAAGGEPEDPTLLAPIVGEAAPQTMQLKLAARYLEKFLRHKPGFVAALLLNGQHGEVAVYSQWHVSGPAPAMFPSEWSVAEALRDSGVDRIDARTFAVDFTAPSDEIHITKATSPRAHFGVFMMEPTSQEQLLERARATAPNSIGTRGLNAISFHRSLDGGEVINLGAWTDYEGLAELLARPGFMGGDEYWLGLANFHNVWFDVAAVVKGH